MENYKIDSNTLAIIPIDENKSKVYEENNILIINKQAKKIVEENCIYYGSSYAGRKESTENLIGISYKSPILIEENENIIFFPTCSPRKKNCGWISLNNLSDIYPNDDDSTVYFKNNSSLKLMSSSNILENQILRASRLYSVIRSRKKD